jgi:uncharacterized protein (DUF58 family)
MMDQEILSQLKDIHLPKAPGFWPPAIGYLLLFGLLLLLIILAGALFFWERPKRKLRRELNAEIADIEKHYEEDGSAVAVQSRISALLRRILAIKMPKLVTKDFLDAKDELGLLFRNRAKLDELIALLLVDRYKRESSVNVMRLLAVFKELVKKCGT